MGNNMTNKNSELSSKDTGEVNLHSEITDANSSCNTCPECGDKNYGTRFSAVAPGCLETQNEEVIEDAESYDHLCVYKNREGTHRFIKAFCEIPVEGQEYSIEFGNFVKLSRLDFEHFQETNLLLDGYASYAGVLSNNIPGYPPTYGKKVIVTISQYFDHPSMDMLDSDHPLAEDMTDGISQEEAEFLVEEILGSISHQGAEAEMAEAT
jgi:hypothetical protein